MTRRIKERLVMVSNHKRLEPLNIHILPLLLSKKEGGWYQCDMQFQFPRFILILRPIVAVLE